MTASPPRLHFDRVSYAYDDTGAGPRFTLADASLALAAGELVAIIGPNGSGKTTLARLANGLLRPRSGRVLINGRDIAPEPVAALASRIGYVFQNPDAQLFAPTVAADVGFGPRNLGLDAATVDARVAAALASLDLTAVADRHPLLLSYGARRLVALAGVLALATPVLILDEPTAGLDAAAAGRLLRAIEARRTRGDAILLISHDLDLVASHATRVVVMAGGRIIAHGPPRAILTDRALLTTAGLAPPRVTHLAQALAAHGIAADRLTVDELVDAIAARWRAGGSAE